MKINFAKNLKKLRTEAKMSQKTLAELLKVNQRTVSAWENEIAEPSFANLAKLCEIFNEDFNNILT
ncbi:MAG: helix-turn-helix transcriptional regulator [Christensenellaceae bacterium]